MRHNEGVPLLFRKELTMDEILSEAFQLVLTHSGMVAVFTTFLWGIALLRERLIEMSFAGEFMHNLLVELNRMSSLKCVLKGNEVLVLVTSIGALLITEFVVAVYIQFLKTHYWHDQRSGIEMVKDSFWRVVKFIAIIAVVWGCTFLFLWIPYECLETLFDLGFVGMVIESITKALIFAVVTMVLVLHRLIAYQVVLNNVSMKKAVLRSVNDLLKFHVYLLKVTFIVGAMGVLIWLFRDSFWIGSHFVGLLNGLKIILLLFAHVMIVPFGFVAFLNLSWMVGQDSFILNLENHC